MLVGTTNLNTTLNLIYVLTDVVETLLNKGMKKRYTKKGEFICRRQKPSDKSFSLKESYRLAYFEVMNRPAYIIRKRKINNVIYVGRNKREADRLLKFFNQ